MIQLIKQNDLDWDAWDACINQDPSGHFYPFHWYLDMVARQWDALVLGDYELVLPLVHRRKWGVIPYLFRPYGVQQLGIFGAKPVTEDITREFITSIPRSYLHKDIYFNVENQFPKDIRHNFRRTYEIPLDQSYQSIYSSYGSQIKRNLKRAEKAGLTIFENDTPDTLVLLFKRNKGKMVGLSDWHYDRMKQIMYALIYRKMGAVWSIHDDRNSPCASCFLAYTSKRMVFLFSGQEPYGQKTGAMTKLIDNAMMWAAERGGVFDFEGSDLRGLERFYKSFGADMKTYPHYRR